MEKAVNTKITVYKIENEFFGENITVAGLICGVDLIKQLKGKPLGTRLLLPTVCFRHERDLMLDGIGIPQLEEELGVKVAHVGLAFFEVIGKSPETELYNADKTHPSATGSYLAAATIIATMLGLDPSEIAYALEDGEEIKAILDAAAYNATVNTPAIPEEYVTQTNK